MTTQLLETQILWRSEQYLVAGTRDSELARQAAVPDRRDLPKGMAITSVQTKPVISGGHECGGVFVVVEMGRPLPPEVCPKPEPPAQGEATAEAPAPEASPTAHRSARNAAPPASEPNIEDYFKGFDEQLRNSAEARELRRLKRKYRREKEQSETDAKTGCLIFAAIAVALVLIGMAVG